MLIRKTLYFKCLKVKSNDKKNNKKTKKKEMNYITLAHGLYYQKLFCLYSKNVK